MSKDLSRLYHQHITFSKSNKIPHMPKVIENYRSKHANFLNRESKKPPMPSVIREYRKSVKAYEDYIALECKKLGYIKPRGLTPKTRSTLTKTKRPTKPGKHYHYNEVNLNTPYVKRTTKKVRPRGTLRI